MNPREDAVVAVLALVLHRAAAAAGRRAEDLLASLSDADLSALYLRCAKKVCAACGLCRTAGPPPPSTEIRCHIGEPRAVNVVSDNQQRESCARF